MTPRTLMRLPLIPVLAALALAGCERDLSGLKPVPPNTDPVVFSETFGDGVDFQAFLGSKLDALAIDPSTAHAGSYSLKITVPSGADGGYAGGAFTTFAARDLSGYNALTFWAKASREVTLDVAGLGNDNTGFSKYEARRTAITLGTAWSRVVIPVPLPEKLNYERGLFFFAEGPEGGAGAEIWLDEVRFETVTAILNPRPSIMPKTVAAFVGGTVAVDGTRTLFTVEGVDRLVEHFSGYFTFGSSNEEVVRVEGEAVRAVGAGTASVTGRLGTVDATGSITVNVVAAPTEAAPSPTVPAGNVISLFSNVYSNRTVDTWSATWDLADVADLRIAGNDVKAYTNLTYAGIEFTTATIDAAAMTHVHLDVWIPQGTNFRVKLVDFGANGIFGGGDDRQHELTFTAGTTPPLVIGAWAPLEIPLSDFTGLTTRGHLAQLILSSGDSRTVFVDNIYFHR